MQDWVRRLSWRPPLGLSLHHKEGEDVLLTGAPHMGEKGAPMSDMFTDVEGYLILARVD